MRALVLMVLAFALRADDLTNKMTERVSEEAAAFVKIAPEMLGTETLHQRTIKPASRFHPRAGAAAKAPPAVEWKEREVVSEYAFSQFGGTDGAIHELRKVITVDGKKVTEPKKAQQALAAAMTAKDDEQKRALLKEFEKYGLTSAVTDFGQLLLLFSRRDIERYEFTARPPVMIGYDRALVWSYKQLDGPEALTLFESSKARRLPIEGEIRVRASDFVPLQITLISQQGDAPSSVREEAAVSYAMTKFSVLMPTSTEHRELRGGKLAMENKFTYTDFHKFGASSELSFPEK
ncbi:MAG TPA: hypothetical protein VKS01_12880 [Bryobacteraceae bacterium]|nr:hypothetical protein [Bryobacteraceae bacterium]